MQRIGDDPDPDKISSLLEGNYNANRLGVLFEIPPQFKEVFEHGQELERFTYSTHRATGKKKFIDGFLTKSLPMFGFRLSPQVPPRFFQGLVFSLLRELTIEEYEKRIANLLEENKNSKYDWEKSETWLRHQNIYRYIKETRLAELIKYADEIGSYMTDMYKNGKENLFIPVYDSDGNLWWPKQMSYIEVKKMIKDKNKTE